MYIRDRLASGSALAHLLLEGLDLASGHAWTYLPPAMTDAQATRFADAGVTRLATGAPAEAFEHSDVRREVVHNLVAPLLAIQIANFLTQDERGIAVWNDPLASAEDRWVRDHPEEPLLFLGQEVYYALSHATVSPAAITAGLSVMGAWWGSPAVLAELSDAALRPFLTPRASLTAQHLQALVDHCRMLFFMAYDGEGYVLWSRAGR
jgi:hypothetical protein